jgi:hypothetical protein
MSKSQPGNQVQGVCQRRPVMSPKRATPPGMWLFISRPSFIVAKYDALMAPAQSWANVPPLIAVQKLASTLQFLFLLV